MDMKLKTVTALTAVDDLVYPFALQAVGDVFIHRLKNSTKITRLKKLYNNRESRMQFVDVTTEKPTEVIKLPVESKAVFDNADWNQKNLLMSDAYLLPDCTLKNTHYVKSRLTENSMTNNSMLAALTTAGMIELYRYSFGSHQLMKLPFDLTELKMEELTKKVIITYKVLVESYNRVAFTDFEWCPVDFDKFKLLLTVTKSDEIIIYSIQETMAKTQHKQIIEGVSKNAIKWAFSKKNGHFLYVGTKEGNLRQFSLNILKDGKVKSFKETEEIKGKVKIPPSNICVDYSGDDTIVFCCKNHSLDIVHKHGAEINVTSKYIGLSITGFEKIDNLEYFASTLNSSIFSIKLGLNSNQVLEIQQQEKIEILLSSDEDVSSKMSFFGVAMSRNKVFAYISALPQHVSIFKN